MAKNKKKFKSTQKPASITGHLSSEELGKIVTQGNSKIQKEINELIYKIDNIFHNSARTICLDAINTEIKDIINTVDGLEKIFDRNKNTLSVLGNPKTLKSQFSGRESRVDDFDKLCKSTELIYATRKVLPKIKELNKYMDKVSHGVNVDNTKLIEAFDNFLQALYLHILEPLIAVINVCIGNSDARESDRKHNLLVHLENIWDAVRTLKDYVIWENNKNPVYAFSETYSTALLDVLPVMTLEDLHIFDSVPMWESIMVQNTTNGNKDKISSFALVTRSAELCDCEFAEINKALGLSSNLTGATCLDFKFYIDLSMFDEDLVKKIFGWLVPTFDMRLSLGNLYNHFDKNANLLDVIVESTPIFSHIDLSELLLSIFGSRMYNTITGKITETLLLKRYLGSIFMKDFEAGGPVLDNFKSSLNAEEAAVGINDEELFRMQEVLYHVSMEIFKCLADLFSCYIKKNINLEDTEEELPDPGTKCERKTTRKNTESKISRKLISVGFTESYACISKQPEVKEHTKGKTRRPHFRRLHTKHVWVGKIGSPERHRELCIIFPTYIHADQYKEEIHGVSRKLINVK